jgi:hypothetical protein
MTEKVYSTQEANTVLIETETIILRIKIGWSPYVSFEKNTRYLVRWAIGFDSLRPHFCYTHNILFAANGDSDQSISYPFIAE